MSSFCTEMSAGLIPVLFIFPFMEGVVFVHHAVDVHRGVFGGASFQGFAAKAFGQGIILPGHAERLVELVIAVHSLTQNFFQILGRIIHTHPGLQEG